MSKVYSEEQMAELNELADAYGLIIEEAVLEWLYDNLSCLGYEEDYLDEELLSKSDEELVDLYFELQEEFYEEN